MSTPPKAAREASARTSMSPSLSMSQATPLATKPPAFALRSAATSSQRVWFRLETTTLAPWATSCCAIPRPIPLVAPVTTATLPVRSNSDMGDLSDPHERTQLAGARRPEAAQAPPSLLAAAEALADGDAPHPRLLSLAGE